MVGLIARLLFGLTLFSTPGSLFGDNERRVYVCTIEAARELSHDNTLIFTGAGDSSCKNADRFVINEGEKFAGHAMSILMTAIAADMQVNVRIVGESFNGGSHVGSVSLMRD